MNYKVIVKNYNKLMYLLALDKVIWNYKYHVLDNKLTLVYKCQLPIDEYYDIYMRHYFDLIITYNYYNDIL